MQDGGAVGNRRGGFISVQFGFIPIGNTRRGEEQLVLVFSHRLISVIGVFCVFVELACCVDCISWRGKVTRG